MTGWRDRAACLGKDPELFSPAGFGPKYWRQVIRAKAVCAGCPVRRACLLDAIAAGDQATIRGARTPPERRRIGKAPDRPERVRVECGTAAGATRHRAAGERKCRACLDYEKDRRLALVLRRCPDVEDRADAGQSLEEVAAAYGMSIEGVSSALRGAGLHAVLTQLRRNAAAEHAAA